MADGQGNINRPNTGTVPKKKYSNNAMAVHSTNDQSKGPRMSNNLTSSWHVPVDSNFIHNKRRNQRNRYSTMDVALDRGEIPNGIGNYSVNGITPASSSSTSRRNSVGSTLKCDNVTKYPDRKQIEDKLSQIREYLEVTSSLMTSIRNSDEQIFNIDEKTNLLQTRNDLLDSEKKLLNLLEELDNNQKVDIETEQSLSNVDNYSDHSGDYIKNTESDFNSYDNELTAMRDQQLSLLKLRQKSENRLMDARHVQEKMAVASQLGSNQMNLDPQKCNKNTSLMEFDSAIRELEERTKRLNRNKPPNENYHADKIMSDMHHLQSQIVGMHEANNEREQLIEVLDNTDTELRSQQAQLKKKLLELQNKKDQVDQLVMQLQCMDEDNQSDVGMQVRNMVTMKDQLNKLKGMLEIVNNTGEHASPAEVQAAANEICLTAENLQNEIAKPGHKRNDSYVENRLDNHVSNDTYQKQLNKAQRNQGAKPKQRSSSINDKLALQSELEAKKRELEEIMGKHKAATSNLNHDVRGNLSNDISWKPPILCQDQDSDDRLSSDADENEYSEVQDTENMIFPQQINCYYDDNRSKRSLGNNRPVPDITPLEPNPGAEIRDTMRHARVRANNQDQEKQDKLQKQLELIKTVCDSVLEQMPTNNQTSSNNIQQVRNNITPSSGYSEQQRVSCPASPFRPNQQQVNVFHPQSDATPWQPAGQNHANDTGNYQNWLSTNTLQTQSFMLNTLNQCCQMLWLQQREMNQLRNTVNVLQERLDLQPYQQQQPQPGTLPSNPIYNQPSTQNNHLRVPPPVPQKTNQVSAACSMPNLNQYNPVTANSDLAFVNTSNVVPNSALLESCLNNVSHLNSTQACDNVNNLLHAVNSNLNQAIPAQIWNGQALNNQVAPGNRANNYWDNFRSYSRQNQLSSKNSDSSIPNAASGLERFHLDRVNPFPVTSTSKSNSEHSSINSRENTPRKRSFKGARIVESVKPTTDHHAPPPDVLNVNQNVHKTTFEQVEMPPASEPGSTVSLKDLELDFSRLSNDEVRIHQQDRQRRNEIRDQRPKKNKLVEELRQNVYKEVASLISANEARPHFLIQLFKDLQKIESDSLRFEILQSVQNILTQSMHCVPNPTVAASRQEGDEPFLQNSYKEIVALLEANEDETIGSHLLANIRQVFVDSELFKDSVKDTVFLKHFSNVLNDVLEQYRGKKVHDVKIHLIQTIGDLLQGELSFIHLIQETIPEGCMPQEQKDSVLSNVAFNVASSLFDIPNNQGPCDNIQNDDLTEADQDQGRLNESELEEEGAVGGIIEVIEENLHILSQDPEDMLSVPIIEFPTNGDGLDQVPIRLPTKIKSGATTPTKDLNPHHDSESY
ncbi:unnamed protein product [Ceutorhynchus assimilis]|uniref:Pericentriolar material 1 protein C-terminal domain-containing protein n=1 Tax=Ceutorhynchus assimilis TaxID=467358 RepID=A0A9N9MIM4_9CUCU|nr:unnamed protein product [Ceutorhynchus assimilis]